MGFEPTSAGATIRCVDRFATPTTVHWTESENARWQGRQDSNPRHAVLETAVLPAELRPCDYHGSLSVTQCFISIHAGREESQQNAGQMLFVSDIVIL